MKLNLDTIIVNNFYNQHGEEYTELVRNLNEEEHDILSRHYTAVQDVAITTIKSLVAEAIDIVRPDEHNMSGSIEKLINILKLTNRANELLENIDAVLLAYGKFMYLLGAGIVPIPSRDDYDRALEVSHREAAEAGQSLEEMAYTGSVRWEDKQDE